MNIIFVMSDTFRSDNLSCYGPTQTKTPRLDEFANQSFVFDNAFLGSFPTIPNRLDIMSGRFSFIDHEWCPLPRDTVTLQQILSASGVASQMIIDNPHMIEMGFNYERGFDAWEWIRGNETDTWKIKPPSLVIPETSHSQRRGFIRKRYLNNTAWWECEEDRFAARTMSEACRWLEEYQDLDQFFLYLDLFDPHEPWDAPRKYIDMYDPDFSGNEFAYPDSRIWKEYFSQDEMDRYRLLYRAETSLVDHWFGVLLDKIDELGLTEDTAIVFTSDHGYLLGEHEVIGKSIFVDVPGRTAWESVPMYNEIRRIPLIIRLPEQTEGRHLEALVQPPDLMPTILEMAGLVVTETFGGQSQTQALQCGVFYTEDWEFEPERIHGKSLMPLMRGETEAHRDVAISSNTIIHHTPLLAKTAIGTEDGWCLHYYGKYDRLAPEARMGSLKVIDPEAARLPIEPELYYVPDDPKEANNLVDGNQKLAEEIHQRYVKWLEEAGTPEEHLAGRRSLR
jgi:arylsulfatase A-like enzyme